VGYWKSNTKEVDIKVNAVEIGRVNSLTFHLGLPQRRKIPVPNSFVAPMAGSHTL
jgi:hypothetical protein